MDSISQLRPNAEFGDYRIENVLRVGTESIVYRAYQPMLDRAVALYVATAPGDSPDGERFLARARLVAAIEHPHVLPVYDVGVTAGRVYAATRLSDGTPAERLDQPLAAEAAVAAVEQTAGALERLQRAGIAFVPSPRTVLVEGDRRAPMALVAPLDVAVDEAASTVAGLGVVLATLAGPSDERLLAVARRATDTTELRSPAAVATAARAAVAAPPRRRWIVGLVGAAVVAAAALVLALVGGGGGEAPKDRPAVNAAPARLVATIPIGEEGTVAAVTGRDVWIVTLKNRLIHIDAATNRVVGAPLHFPHSSRGLSAAAGHGFLYVLDADGTVSRLDPHTGRVLRHTHVGAVVGAVTVGPDALWLTRSPPDGSRTGHDVLMRLDLHSLRRLAPPIPVGFHPFDIEVGEGYADTMNKDGSTVTRVDVKTRRTREVLIGPKPSNAAIADGRLWIPDPIAAVLTGIDPLLTRPANVVLPVGSAYDTIVAGGALWVILTRGVSPVSPARLIRVDPSTGRLVGGALELHSSAGTPAAGDGALWIPLRSRHAVVRLVPTVPRPATHAVRPPASGALHSGPATRGRKQARVTDVSFTIDVRSRGWIVAAEPYIADVRRFDNFGIGMSVVVPAQVFGPHGSAHKVTSPRQVLSVLRTVPELEVGRATETAVSGVRAESVMLRVRPGAPRPGFCAIPCAVLYSRDQVTVYVSPAMRLTLVRSTAEPWRSPKTRRPRARSPRPGPSCGASASADPLPWAGADQPMDHYRPPAPGATVRRMARSGP